MVNLETSPPRSAAPGRPSPRHALAALWLAAAALVPHPARAQAPRVPGPAEAARTEPSPAPTVVAELAAAPADLAAASSAGLAAASVEGAAAPADLAPVSTDLTAGSSGLEPGGAPGLTFAAYEPITGAERRQRVKDLFLSPQVPIRSLVSAGLSQLAEEPEEWGSGADGFGRRVASSLGRRTLRGLVREAMSASLDLDPRYNRCRCAGFFRRTGHALAMTVVSPDADGRLRFDPSEVGSAYVSTMVATAWYPESYGPFDQGLRNGHIRVGISAGTNVLREFWPDVRRVLPGFRGRR